MSKVTRSKLKISHLYSTPRNEQNQSKVLPNFETIFEPTSTRLFVTRKRFSACWGNSPPSYRNAALRHRAAHPFRRFNGSSAKEKGLVQYEHYAHTAPYFPSSTTLSVFLPAALPSHASALFLSVLFRFPAQSSVPQANPAFPIWSCGTLHRSFFLSSQKYCRYSAFSSLMQVGAFVRTVLFIGINHVPLRCVALYPDGLHRIPDCNRCFIRDKNIFLS